MDQCLTADETSAWRSWIATSRRLHEYMSRSLQQAEGISLADFEILSWLAEADGNRMRMNRLADLVVSSRSRLSHQINRLEERGLVVRENCEDDGRGLNAVLTTRGMKVYREAAPSYSDAIRGRFFDSLTSRDVNAICRACGKLSAALSEPKAGRARVSA